MVSFYIALKIYQGFSVYKTKPTNDSSVSYIETRGVLSHPAEQHDKS